MSQKLFRSKSFANLGNPEKMVYYFMHHTLTIHNASEEPACKYTHLVGPGRFGKSTSLSMLEGFWAATVQMTQGQDGGVKSFLRKHQKTSPLSTTSVAVRCNQAGLFRAESAVSSMETKDGHDHSQCL